jgi:hypothetical protein
VKLAECPSFGKTINAYAPQSNGAVDYEFLADEFLALHGDMTDTEAHAQAVSTARKSSEAAPPSPAASQQQPPATAAKGPAKTPKPSSPAAAANAPAGTTDVKADPQAAGVVAEGKSQV